MDLRDYVRIARKSWALILAITVVGIALGVGLTLATTKVYQASTEIFVSTTSLPADSSSGGGGLNNGGQFVQQRVQSYTDLATSDKVLARVVADQDVKDAVKAAGETPLNSDTLAGKISADAPLNKVIINLHVTDTNPTVAATIANALSGVFNDEVGNHFEQKIKIVDSSGNATEYPAVTLTTSHPAIVPSDPIKPNKILNIGLGFVLGLLIGIGVAVVREILDNTVKSARDFEELGIPMLAQVAFDKRAARNPIAFRGDAHSARSEAYRQLRTNLQFVDVDNPPRIIAVTSAIPGEGKSTTAINLAAALAEAGSRVCLVEADLRRPSIAKALGLVSDVGFTTAVIGKAPVETVLQNAGRNLAVLTCGPIPPNPSELLISQHAKQVIYDIAAKVDYTIIDTPPLLPVTDGAEISTIADATLLVHRAARTTRDQAARSLEALAKVGRRPVGVILNMVTRSSGGRYDYEYGYYYSAYRPSTTAAAMNSADADAATTSVSDKSAASDETLRSGAGRRARHRGAAAVPVEESETDSFTPVADTPGTPGTPAAAPVESDSVGDSVHDAVGDAVHDPAPSTDVDAVDDYDDFYDEDDHPTESFAPLNGDGHDGRTASDAPGQPSLGERINGRGDSPISARGARGPGGRRRNRR